MKEAVGFAAPRAIKDAKIGQLQHPNLQVQSALESSGFEVEWMAVPLKSLKLASVVILFYVDQAYH